VDIATNKVNGVETWIRLDLTVIPPGTGGIQSQGCEGKTNFRLSLYLGVSNNEQTTENQYERCRADRMERGYN